MYSNVGKYCMYSNVGKYCMYSNVGKYCMYSNVGNISCTVLQGDYCLLENTVCSTTN